MYPALFLHKNVAKYIKPFLRILAFARNFVY